MIMNMDVMLVRFNLRSYFSLLKKINKCFLSLVSLLLFSPIKKRTQRDSSMLKKDVVGKKVVCDVVKKPGGGCKNETN